MKKLILLLLFFPLNLSAQYFETFSKQDIILESVFVGLVCIDWAQTKHFISEGRKESNMALGSRPSQERIDTLIPLGIVSHVLFIYFLKKNLRAGAQVASISIEFIAVSHNYNAEERHHNENKEKSTSISIRYTF